MRAVEGNLGYPPKGGIGDWKVLAWDTTRLGLRRAQSSRAPGWGGEKSELFEHPSVWCQQSFL